MVVAALLAPPASPPIAVRLYNLMHYGRSDALASSLVVAVALVAGLLALGALVLRVAAHKKPDHG